METPKKRKFQLGCFGWIVVVALAVGILAGLFAWITEETNDYDGPSQSLMNIKCDRAIAPDRSANYQVVNTGNSVYRISGDTLAGSRYYCEYVWSGGENISLLDWSVSP